MGFRFRKSVNIGGFRINISKSGIGYSYGTKGYRVTKKVNGGIRETFSVPGTGLSYVKDYPTNKIDKSNTEQNIDSKSIDVTQYTESSATDLINKCKSTANKNSYIVLGKVIGIALGVLLAVAINVHIILKVIIGLIPIIGSFFIKKLSINLDYVLDENRQKIFDKTNEYISCLGSCDGFWNITSETYVENTNANSGCSSLYKFGPARIIDEQDLFTSNLKIQCLDIGNIKLYFLPEFILMRSGNDFGAISYSKINCVSFNVNFVENRTVPEDTEILGYNWKYQRKDGGPDNRFSFNTKIPRCAYSKFSLLTEDESIKISLLCSNREKADKCSNGIIKIQKGFRKLDESQEFDIGSYFDEE